MFIADKWQSFEVLDTGNALRQLILKAMDTADEFGVLSARQCTFQPAVGHGPGDPAMPLHTAPRGIVCPADDA